jgi:hypothetical protein
MKNRSFSPFFYQIHKERWCSESYVGLIMWEGGVSVNLNGAVPLNLLLSG